MIPYKRKETSIPDSKLAEPLSTVKSQTFCGCLIEPEEEPSHCNPAGTGSVDLSDYVRKTGPPQAINSILNYIVSPNVPVATGAAQAVNLGQIEDSYSPILTFDNGLTRSGNNIQFGGLLLHDSIVSLNSNSLTLIGGNTSYDFNPGYLSLHLNPNFDILSEFVMLSTKSYWQYIDGSAINAIELKGDTTAGASSIVITDTFNHKGAEYAGNYTANFTTRSLIDKGFADATYAPITGGGYVPNARTLTINGTLYDLSANRTWTVGDALVANPLSQFAATTSAQLRATLTDETGNGAAYFQNGDLGTPSAGVATHITGLPLTSGVTGILPIANGGTGSATQNFVDLTTAQTIAGTKTFSVPIRVNGVSLVTGGGGWDAVVRNSSTGELEIGLTNLWFPSQTSNSGKVLSTNGSDPTWVAQSTLTAGNVITNANLTGEVTSVGNAATLTNSAVIGKVLTGYISGAGTVSATDSLLQAIQKLNGNIGALTTGVSSVTGTTNRITASPTSGNVIVDISVVYAGQTSITTLGTVITGIWNGTAITDTYISSAATWNAKQAALSGTGFVKISGTTISYDNSTYLTGNQTITFAPTGDVTGSTTGATSLAPVLSIGAAKVTNTMLAGSIDLTTKVTGILSIVNGGTGVSTGAINNITTVQSSSNFNIDGLATVTKAAIGTAPTDGLLLTQPTAATVGAQKISPSLHFNGNAWNTTGSVSESADFYNYMIPVQGATPTANLLWVYSRAGGGQTTAMTLSSAGNLTLPGILSVTGKSNLADNIAIGSGAAANYSLLINKNATGATTIRGVFVNSAIQSDVTAGYSAFEFNNTTQATAFTLGTFNGFNANFNSKGAGSSITEMNGFVVQNNLTAGTNNYAFRGKINSGTGRWNIFIDGSATNYINGSLLLGTTTDDGVNKLQVNGGIAGSTGSFTTITLSNPTGLIGAGNALTGLGSASIQWSNVHSQILTSYNYSIALGYIYQTGNMAGSAPNILASGTGGSATGWNYSNGNAEVDFFANNGGGANQGGYQFYDWDGTTATSLFRIHKSGFVGIGYTADPASGNKLAVNGDSYLSGNITIGGPINSTATQTTVNGTISGSIICSQPLQGSSYKKVVIYFNNLSSTGITYTFPTAFTNTPNSNFSTTGASSIVSLTSSSITVTGTAAVGWITLEGY
jgi:hypothetical protein